MIRQTFKASLSLLSFLLLSFSAQAFHLKHLDSLNVSDANYCGDFAQLSTYDLFLDTEELESDFLRFEIRSAENVRRVEREVRTRFLVSAQSRSPVIYRQGKSVLDRLSRAADDNMEYCFRTDFQELFGFTLNDEGEAKLTEERDMHYWQMSFIDDSYGLTGYTYYAIFDFKAKKFYLYQLW